MDVTAESLHERYSSMNTEALSDLYHESELTDLAVSVLKDVITSRGLDFNQFTGPLAEKPSSESQDDWSLWKPGPVQRLIGARRQSKQQHEATAKNLKRIIAGIVVTIALSAAYIGFLFVITDTDHSVNRRSLVLIHFIAATAVALLTGLVKLGSAILQMRRTNPRGCEIAEGRVISREINRTSVGESARFTLNVRYEYVALGIRRESQFNHKSQEVWERDRLASLYQPECKIRVHYDPSVPDRCWLNYDERIRARKKLVFGLYLTAVGVIILALLLIRAPVIRYFDNLTGPIHPYFWIAIGFALFMGMFFFLAGIADFHLLRLRDWSSIDGRVISVGCSDYPDEGGGMVYGLSVLYEYIVEGIAIRSCYDGSRSSESERDEIAPLYQPDHKIIVHFDPADPSISWIEKKSSETSRKTLIFGVNVIVVAILIFVLAVFVAF